MKNKTKKLFIATSLVMFLFGISFVNAAIVPNCEGRSCDFLQFMQLINNIKNFIIAISIVLAGIVIGYGGFLYIISGVNISQRQKALSNIKKAIIGLVVVLIAWLLIEIVIRVLVNPATFGKLSAIFG